MKARRSPERRGTVVVPLRETLVGGLHDPMLLLLGGVAAVLVIACANLANLLLARAIARQREFAIRVCLGASPRQVVRQLLVESALLALGGSLLGLGVAFWVSRILGGFALGRLSHLQSVGMDGTVLLFTASVGASSVILFGVAPALRSRRLDLQGALREESRASRGLSRRRLSDRLVIAHVALALVLLTTAGLLVRSFAELVRQDAGFDPASRIVARVIADGAAYQTEGSLWQVFQRLGASLQTRPELTSVALSSTAPFSRGNHQRNYFVEGKELLPGEQALVMSLRSVTPAYFATIGTTILQGRPFSEQDGEEREFVAIVDEGLARLEWPRGDAIGKRIRFETDPDEPWRTIVGVVRSIKHGDLAKPSDRYVYLPFAQYPQHRMDVIVHSNADPAMVVAILRAELAKLDAAIPLFDIHMLPDAMRESVEVQRLLSQLLLAFALTALLLAVIGLYGVMALNVSQRFPRIRSAPGARRIPGWAAPHGLAGRAGSGGGRSRAGSRRCGRRELSDSRFAVRRATHGSRHLVERFGHPPRSRADRVLPAGAPCHIRRSAPNIARVRRGSPRRPTLPFRSICAPCARMPGACRSWPTSLAPALVLTWLVADARHRRRAAWP